MTEPMLELVPVRTRIVTPKDNIVDIIEQYAGKEIGPHDVVSVAESVLAISQGRLLYMEDMKPRFSARLLCRFVPQKGSLGSTYGMEAAMMAEGEGRVIFAFLIGALGKLVGKSGIFYQLAGRQAALIDDVTGTMPPFDKCIVYGPENSHGVAEEIKRRFGCYGAAVADVNDLKRALVVGVSEGLEPKQLAQILIDNPFGNASQQTPIVIIKNYGLVASRAAAV